MLGWLIDLIPWWIWAVLAVGGLAATYTLWRPVWAILPTPIKAAAIVIATGAVAYLAGRNKGAANADARAQAKDQANADKIAAAGSKARADSQRSTAGDRVRDHDPYERKSR